MKGQDQTTGSMFVFPLRAAVGGRRYVGEACVADCRQRSAELMQTPRLPAQARPVSWVGWVAHGPSAAAAPSQQVDRTQQTRYATSRRHLGTSKHRHWTKAPGGCAANRLPRCGGAKAASEMLAIHQAVSTGAGAAQISRTCKLATARRRLAWPDSNPARWHHASHATADFQLCSQAARHAVHPHQARFRADLGRLGVRRSVAGDPTAILTRWDAGCSSLVRGPWIFKTGDAQPARFTYSALHNPSVPIGFSDSFERLDEATSCGIFNSVQVAQMG